MCQRVRAAPQFPCFCTACPSPHLPPAALLTPGIIDDEKKVRHSKLADKIEEVISEPSKIEIKLKVRRLKGRGRWASRAGAS